MTAKKNQIDDAQTVTTGADRGPDWEGEIESDLICIDRPSSERIRIECLKMAVETRQSGQTESQLIARAEKFEAWIVGGPVEEISG